MASNYRGYARRGSFDPIKAPTQIVDKLLQQGQDYGNKLRQNQQIKRRQEDQYQNQVNKNAQIEQENAWMREQSIRRDNALQRDAHLKNLNQKYKNALQGVENANRTAASLARFSSTLSQGIAQYQQEREEQQFAEGLNLVYQYGISPEEALELRLDMKSSEVTSNANSKIVESMMARGVPGEVIEKFRQLSGHAKLGAEKAVMLQAGEGWMSYRTENLNREFDVGGRQVTLAELESNLDIAGVKALDSILRTEYFRKFKSFDPAMASEFMMEPMRKADAARYRELDVAKTKQVYADVKAEDQQRTWITAEAEGAQAVVDMAMLEAAGSDDPNAIRNARRKRVSHIAEGVEMGAIDAEIAEELLELPITLKGQSPRSFESLYRVEAAQLREAIMKSRKADMAEFNLSQAEKKRRGTEWTEKVMQSLYKGDVRREEVEALIDAAEENGFYQAVPKLTNFLENNTIEAKQEEALDKSFEQKFNMGYLTPEEISAAPASLSFKDKWLGKLNSQGGSLGLSSESKTSAKNFIKARLTERVELDALGEPDASLVLAQNHAFNKVLRDTVNYRRQGMGEEEALQNALKNFNEEFADEKGTYAVRPLSLGPSGEASAEVTFDRFDLTTANGKAEKSIPIPDVGRMLQANPNVVRERPLIPSSQIQQYQRQLNNAGRGVIPPMAIDISRQLGGSVSPLDVMNMQAQLQGLPVVTPPEYDESAKSRISPRIQRLINQAPTYANMEIAHREHNHNHGTTPGVNMEGRLRKTPEQTAALDAIAKYESEGAGGYNAMNEGGTNGGRTVVGYSGPSKGRLGRNLTDMTIGEVIKLQQQGKLHAAGRYQFIGNTLPGVVRDAGLSNDTLFNAETQDILGLTLMRQRGIQPWIGPVDKATNLEREMIRRAAAQQISLGPSPWRQGSNMRFEVIEHLTGHRGHRNYDAAHGGTNYHEHIAFRTREQRDAAIILLRQNGIRVGSIDRPGDDGYHGQGLAIDIPADQVPVGEEEALSKRVWQVLGMSGIN